MTTDETLALLRDTLRGTEYDNRVFLVGGYVRDKLLGRAPGKLEDIDLVIEDDALVLAEVLYRRGASRIRPVTFETFGTAMVKVAPKRTPETEWAQVELVTARAETYRHGSRKPIVTPGTLQTDAERRDFTVNTFLENLHTGEIVDPTGQGRADLQARLLRTPLDPDTTFADDPLRMLRACRFAAKLGFTIETATLAAIHKNAFKCTPEYGISFERVRDELNKTLLAPGAATGLEQMRETGLLKLFAPELAHLHGVTQNRYHKYDVWEHTLVALGNLPPDASLLVRLGVLLHDVGKLPTRTVDTDGNVHFYEHEEVGAKIAQDVLTRLRYSADEIKTVVQLVALHMRYGAYNASTWTEAAVRRLIRTVGPLRTDLFTLARADVSACNTDDYPVFADLDGLQARMEQIENTAHVTQATSPLDGQAIIVLLGIKPGPIVGKIKDALTDAVVAGELAPDDIEGAERMARDLFTQLTQ